MNTPNSITAVLVGILLSGCTFPGAHDVAIPLCASFTAVSSTDPSGYFTDAAYFRICVKEPDDCFRRAFQIVKGGNFRFNDREMVHPRPIDMAYWWFRRTGSHAEFDAEFKNFHDFSNLSEVQSLAASAIQVIVPEDLYSRCVVFFNREPIATIRDGVIRFSPDTRTLSYAPCQTILSDRVADDAFCRWNIFDARERGSRFGFAGPVAIRYFAKPQTMLETGNYLLLEYNAQKAGLVRMRAQMIRSDRFSISVSQETDCMFVRKGIWCYVDPVLDSNELLMQPHREASMDSILCHCDYEEAPENQTP